MKVYIGIGWLIFFSFLLIIATYFLLEYFNEPAQTITVKPRGAYDIVTLKLPTTHDPAIFGPEFWKVRHKLSEMVPCPSCQREAVSHEKFFHDIVNLKTDKPIMFKENFDKWVKRICEMKTNSAIK